MFDLLILRQGFTPVAPALEKQNKVFLFAISDILCDGSLECSSLSQFVLFKANK